MYVHFQRLFKYLQVYQTLIVHRLFRHSRSNITSVHTDTSTHTFSSLFLLTPFIRSNTPIRDQYNTSETLILILKQKISFTPSLVPILPLHLYCYDHLYTCHLIPPFPSPIILPIILLSRLSTPNFPLLPQFYKVCILYKIETNLRLPIPSLFNSY